MKDYITAKEIVDGNSKKLQNRLAEEREAAGYTQEKLAECLNYKNAQTISNWETGVSPPSLKTMMILAEMYECDLDHLTGRLDPPTHDMAFIQKETGLSVEAIKALKEYHEKKQFVVSWLIENPSYLKLIRSIFILLVYGDMIDDEGGKDVLEFKASRMLLNIVDEIREAKGKEIEKIKMSAGNKFAAYQLANKKLRFEPIEHALEQMLYDEEK